MEIMTEFPGKGWKRSGVIIHIEAV